MWCGVLSALHSADRTHTLAEKISTLPQFPQSSFDFSFSIFQQKLFKKKCFEIFSAKKLKNRMQIANELCGWGAGVDNTTVKKTETLQSTQQH